MKGSIMKQPLDYETDTQIDPGALDVEWLGQAGLYMRYSEECARADLEARRAEEKMKTIRSDLILEAHADPEVVKDSSGKPAKSTAQSIEAWYRTQPEYKEAKRLMHEAQSRLAMLQNALTALRMRKEALENLVRLNGQNYFASPSVPRDLSKEWERNTRHGMAADKVRTALGTTAPTTERKSRRTK